MQVIIKASGERRPDSGDLLEIGGAGTQYALHATEMLQERPPLRRPETWYGFQHRFVITARALAPMAGDREAMRLVPYPLHEPRGGRVSLRNAWLGDSVDEQPLLSGPPIRPLGDAHERKIAEPQPGEHLVHQSDLSLAAIDQQQVRQGDLALPDPDITSLERLAKRTVVIARCNTRDVETAILLLQRTLGAEHDAG